MRDSNFVTVRQKVTAEQAAAAGVAVEAPAEASAVVVPRKPRASTKKTAAKSTRKARK